MQLSGTVLRVIEQVVHEAELKPADAALRQALRGSDLNPDQKSLISEVVFTYFRWLGWLASGTSLRGQLEHALELSSSRVKDAEVLQKAVPAWARQVADLSSATLREFQVEPRLWLRARPGTREQLARKLEDCEQPSEAPDALWYYGKEDLFRTPEFHGGEFEIQDLSSQIVGHSCAPALGATWWDACAGEGGKTLHLCDLMRNKGLVWASDPALWRLDLLKRRAKRAKIFNYRIKPWKSHEHLPTKARFDGVLIDAPCSGLGTWGRNPHARWTTTPEEIPKLAALQAKILNTVAASVKGAGKLVYSVCTLTRAETTEIANAFSAAHPEFKPTGQKMILPEQFHSGGMFIASWQRTS